MRDQAEIHKKCISKKIEERREAIKLLRIHFSTLADRDQAWQDLLWLTKDRNIIVREGALDSLELALSQVPDKDQAWQDLLWLIKDEDSRVRGIAACALGRAFSQVPDNNQAWQDLHDLTKDEDSRVRCGAAYALGEAFSNIPDKDQAWQDLHGLTNDEDRLVRSAAVIALLSVSVKFFDKDQAWQDLLRLTNDEDGLVRGIAAEALRWAFCNIPDKDQAWQNLLRLTKDTVNLTIASPSEVLGSVFGQVPDKDQAWQDLHGLTNDEDSSVREKAANALGWAFSNVPDKDQAWKDLHGLANDVDNSVREEAAEALGWAFCNIPDKDQALQDLHELTNDEDSGVRRGATEALGWAFSNVPDKDRAWQDLHRLAKDKNNSVRWETARALGSVFDQIPDKDQAWKDLHRLTKDKNNSVRWKTAYSLGSVFDQIPDKDQAWKDLHGLTKDKDKHVRVHAYYSLGRASVFKATEKNDKETLKNELEAAVGFFERSSMEGAKVGVPDGPAQFCGRFYRTYFAITFQEPRNDEVQWYLAEAKESVGKSETKAELLKAVENLAGALQESQRLKDKSVQEIGNELNVYKWYCDRAAEHMAAAEDKTPWAVKLMRICNPFLEDRIQATIAEIQEKARQICLITHKSGTEFEKLGVGINKAAKSLSSEDLFSMQKSISIIASQLEDLCTMLPDNTKILACKTVKEMQSTKEIPDKLDKIKQALAYIYPVIEVSLQARDMRQDIKNEIHEAKKAIIENDYEIKRILLEHLDENQKIVAEAILNAVGERYQDLRFQKLLEETLTALAEMLNEIQKKEALDSDPTIKDKVKSTTKIIEDRNVNLKRKLEVTIPLIPVLLNYKWDVELEGGDINLRAAWKKLRSSLRI